MIRITICPTCGSDKIKRLRRNWTGRVQGKTYTVADLEYSNVLTVVKESTTGRQCGK